MILTVRLKGGPGSGNFDHAGRPGLVGGSADSMAYRIHASMEDLVSAGKLGDLIGFWIAPNGDLISGNDVSYGRHDEIAKDVYASGKYSEYFKNHDIDTINSQPFEDIALRAGFIRIEYSDMRAKRGIISDHNAVRIINIESVTIDKPTLHRLQSTLIHDVDRILWSAAAPLDEWYEFSGQDFFVYDSVHGAVNSKLFKESQTTAMIGFDLSDDWLAASIVKDDKAKPPHITLVFLGEADNLETFKDEIINRLRSFAGMHKGIDGILGGFGVFPAHEGVAPVVLLFDSPDLVAFRQALYHTFGDMPLEPQRHGYTAHMTIQYTDAEHVRVPTEEVTHLITVNAISLFWGNEIIKFDLIGDIVEKELPIDDTSKSRLIDIRNNIFNNTVDALSERMYTGDMSIGQWEEAMKAEIKALHTSSAVIGKGEWGNMTQSDWGRVGQQVRQQYRYLHNFAENIADNSALSLRAIQARSHLYANASKHTATVLQAGEFAGGTRRQPGRFKGLPWMPRDGSTECLVGCKCHWKLDVIDKTKDWKLVQCVWTLTPAEHCDTCIERRGHTEIIKVPADTDVPPIVGGL